MANNTILGSWKNVNFGDVIRQQHNVRNISKMSFQQRVKLRINAFFRRYGDAVAIGMCLRFATAAAKYTPPKNRGKWTGSIQDSLYFRPIQDLRLLVKGQYPRCHASRKDYQMLRQGYLYRVMNTKYRHKRQDAVVAYAKGINEAKRLSRIQNRGISKFSWGSMINNIKEDIAQAEIMKSDIGTVGSPQGIGIYRAQKLPPIFQRLAKKSPNITKFQWGSYNWQYEPNINEAKKINFTIINRLAQIERYGQVAIKMGIKAADKYAKKIWSALGATSTVAGFSAEVEGEVAEQRRIVEGIRRNLAALFNDDAQKYGIQQLMLQRSVKNQQLTKEVMSNLNVVWK